MLQLKNKVINRDIYSLLDKCLYQITCFHKSMDANTKIFWHFCLEAQSKVVFTPSSVCAHQPLSKMKSLDVHFFHAETSFSEVCVF